LSLLLSVTDPPELLVDSFVLEMVEESYVVTVNAVVSVLSVVCVLSKVSAFTAQIPVSHLYNTVKKILKTIVQPKMKMKIPLKSIENHNEIWYNEFDNLLFREE
jgi:hypothetical protein